MMSNVDNIIIRSIVPADNLSLATIIRSTLAEFGANHPGTVYFDASTDRLSELFRKEKSTYFVAEINGNIVGGGGIFPTDRLPEGTCELVKMYLLPEARGKGLGRTIIEHCLKSAAEYGFRSIYLESMPELKHAVRIYERFGFEYLSAPLGDSGHFGCDLWMLKKL
jgi:putative acetyltransferase